MSLFCLLTGTTLFYQTFASSLERQLHASLMKNYEKDVRPTAHHWLATNITFGFMLQQIVDLDEKNQFLTTRAWLNINWLDQRLKWNSSAHGGLKLLSIPHRKIWKPDIILTNNADQLYVGETMSTDVLITSRGNVTWLASALFKSTCSIHVKYFPFDYQLCYMNFTSWTHNGHEIDLLLLTEKGDVSSYVKHGEFDLLSLTAKKFIASNICCAGKPWPVIAMLIRLKRRPFFYIVNHIMPGALFAAMGLTGFMIPPDSGEKVTMCITTMLAMGVYLKTITEQIPASEDLPLLAMYYAVLLFMVCIFTVGNIWTLNIYWSGTDGSNDHEIPEWMRTWILGWMAWILQIKHPTEIEKAGRTYFQKKRKKRDLRKVEASKLKQLEVSQLRKTSESIASLLLPYYETETRQKRGDMEISSHRNSVLSAEFEEIYDEVQLTFQSVLDAVWDTLVRDQKRERIDQQRCQILKEWKNVALVLDRLLLYCFVIITALCTVLILFQPHFLN